jgi:hypothetical protein
MKRLVVVLVGGLAAGACQTFPNPFATRVNVPFFEPLTTGQLCGGFNEACQPTSSRTFQRLRDPVDYNGNPASLLGRSYVSIYEHRPCTSTPVYAGRTDGADDVEYFGQTGINGRLNGATRAAFNLGLSGDLDAYVAQTFPNFPQGFQAEAKSKLEQKFQSAIGRTASITYHRMDLSRGFMDRELDACLDRLPRNEKVITGVSLITVSGEWSQDIVRETMAELEASASYRALSASQRVEFSQRREFALRGTFEPVAVPFAVAYRWGRAPIPPRT